MHKHHSTNPAYILGCVWRQRALLVELTSREVIGRYRGSAMGLLWSFFNPVLMLSIYTFVFSVVFKMKWTPVSESKTEFAIIIFSGMIIHAIFSECITRAPGLVVGNPNFVKKVVFPLEILPWAIMGSALFHALVSVVVLLVFVIFYQHALVWTVVYFPLVLAPFVLLTMGVSWWLASLGVYIRDVAQTTGIVSTVLLFMSPVFFPVSALPEQYRIFFHLNPLTFVIEQAREVLLWGNAPNWSGLGIYTLVGVAAAWAGLFWFQKTRRGFADVI